MTDNTIPCASNDQSVWVMNAVPDIQVVDPETGEAITLVSRNVDDDDYILGLATNPCLATTNATAAEAVTTEETGETAATTEEGTKPSFYSCGSDGGTGDVASSFLPDDATEVTLVYDYELHTSSPLDADVLSSFENSVAYDLANRYGLIDCRRRNLRSLEGGGLIALDSAPMDESLTDTCESSIAFSPFPLSNRTPHLLPMNTHLTS
jgi:hypothetical protein